MDGSGNSQRNPAGEKLHTLVRENDKAGVETLLKEGPQGGHIVEYKVDGLTALHVAANNGNAEMVEILINVGRANIHVRSNEGNTPLHMAALGGHAGVVEKLLKEGGISDLIAEDKRGDTPMHGAAQSGNQKIVKRLLSLAPSRQACIFAKNGELRTPLHYAAGSNNHNVVELLLGTKESQELKEAQDEFGAIPFHFAARCGNVASLKMLAPGDVNVTSKNGFTALHYAAWNARVDAVKWLLDMGASPKYNDRKDTPLHFAAICDKPGSDKVVEIIVSKDPDSWKMEDFNGQLAIGLADQHDHGDVVRAFLRSLRRFKPTGNGQEILKAKHKPIDATLLHYAAGHGTKEDIEWLVKTIEKGRSVNDILDDASRAPLHWAAMKGNISTLRALASAEADLRQVGSKGAGETPLFLALGEGHIEFAEALLQCDKEISISQTRRRLTTDEWMEGVAHWLMTYYNEKVEKHVKAELEAGFKQHTRKQSATWLPAANGGAIAAFQEIPPLYLALHAGRLDIAKFFQRLSSEEDAVNKKGSYTGMTSLHWAVLLHKRGIVEQLCSIKLVPEFSERVRVCEEDVNGIAPIQYAMEMNMLDIEAVLFKRPGVASYIEGLYRDRQIYVDSTNAILVGAALIASVTFAGWLQPPLGYTDTEMGVNYAAIRQHTGVRFFWVLNSLSFFAAIGTVQAGACGVIPLRQVHIGRSVNYIRRALMVASFLMALSVVCVLGAFGAAGFVVLPPILKFEVYMMSTIAFGGLINAGLILWFVQRVFVAPRLFHVWKRHLLGNTAPPYRSSPPPDLRPDNTTGSPPPMPQSSMGQQNAVFPWDDGIEELYSHNQSFYTPARP
eukprot:c20533_g1_i1 orf=284-2809(+)